MARIWHGLVATVATFALMFQLVLVVRGDAVLVDAEPPSMADRLIRFISYFTILSNILVAYTSAALARDPQHRGRVWNVLRLNAIVGIAITGIIHWFFLRPILDLHGASYAVDKLLHVVVPIIAIIGWVAFGPRDRIRPADLLPSLIYPLVWVAYTLIRGAAVDWYPYPFIDVTEHGYGPVAINCLGVAVLLLAFSVGALYADRRLPHRKA